MRFNFILWIYSPIQAFPFVIRLWDASKLSGILYSVRYKGTGGKDEEKRGMNWRKEGKSNVGAHGKLEVTSACISVTEAFEHVSGCQGSIKMKRWKVE